VLVLPAEGLAEIRDLEDEGLEALQHLVGGDIEELHFDGGLMIMNTDGRSLKLPINRLATSFVGRTILGDVVVCGGADEDGQLLPYQATDGPQGGPVKGI